MGGCPDGEQASKTAVETFELYLRDEKDSDGDLQEVILAAFGEANRRIEKHATGSGTTVVAAEVHEEWMRTYHCGDSGAILSPGERLFEADLPLRLVGMGAVENRDVADDSGHVGAGAGDEVGEQLRLLPLALEEAHLEA